MTTHYHLVLHSTQPDLSRGLQRLNGRYAQWFNDKHVRFGPLFAGRFKCRVIEDERYLVEACNYVVENPVRALHSPQNLRVALAHSRYSNADERLRPGLTRDVPTDLDVVEPAAHEPQQPLPLLLGHLL